LTLKDHQAQASGLLLYTSIKNQHRHQPSIPSNQNVLPELTIVVPALAVQKVLVSPAVIDYWVLMVGVGAGFLLKYIKVNPMLVLGGLLMSINFSLSLILGGFLAFITPQAQEWYPFWSGVFASNSLWIVIKTML